MKAKTEIAAIRPDKLLTALAQPGKFSHIYRLEHASNKRYTSRKEVQYILFIYSHVRINARKQLYYLQ